MCAEVAEPVPLVYIEQQSCYQEERGHSQQLQAVQQKTIQMGVGMKQNH